LFVHVGLSAGEITGLFALWSVVGVVAEVPAGALADRYSRRGALVAAGALQAGGYALWILIPGLLSFAAGFVCWGMGGALVSGALEALLYDGLASAGAEAHFPAVFGRVTAVSLLAQLPAAAGATLLFSAGGYALAGWVSVGCCLGAAALASRLPEAPRRAEEDEAGGAGYLATLRAGLAEAASRAAVRRLVLAVSLLGGLDALDEYFPLIAHHWGVPTAVVPLAVLAIPLAGAAGAAAGGRPAWRGRPWVPAVMLGTSGLVLGAAGLWRQPAGLAGVACYYGIYRWVLVIINARLQQAIGGPSRATVTSVAALGTQIATFGLYAAWVLGQVVPIAGLVLVAALFLARLPATHDDAHP
jgi:MFS family permease